MISSMNISKVDNKSGMQNHLHPGFFRLWVLIFGALIVCLTSCSDADEGPFSWDRHMPFTSEFETADLSSSTVFASKGESRGTSTLSEASGLAYSQKNPGFIWTHQDKNNDNRIFLLDVATGETVASYRVSGTQNRDWEDIEIGPGPEADVPYLYVGDIGDNNQVYSSYRIFRFEEPEFNESHRGQIVTLDIEFDQIDFTYPDKSHDVEALLIDPETLDIFLATKRDFVSMLFVLPYPQSSSESMQAIHAGDFPFRGTTAGCFSRDGKEALIKNGEKIYFWQRKPGQQSVEMFSDTPELAPYDPVEVQGEAISFDDEGGYYTISEFSNGVTPELYYYQRVE